MIPPTIEPRKMNIEPSLCGYICHVMTSLPFTLDIYHCVNKPIIIIIISLLMLFTLFSISSTETPPLT